MCFILGLKIRKKNQIGDDQITNPDFATQKKYKAFNPVLPFSVHRYRIVSRDLSDLVNIKLNGTLHPSLTIKRSLARLI